MCIEHSNALERLILYNIYQLDGIYDTLFIKTYYTTMNEKHCRVYLYLNLIIFQIVTATQYVLFQCSSHVNTYGFIGTIENRANQHASIPFKRLLFDVWVEFFLLNQ